MTRSSCLALTAGVTVLGAASVATADLVTQPVSFSFEFLGPYPGTVESWLIEHDLEVTFDEFTGNIESGFYQAVEATFVVGGEQITVGTEIRYEIPENPDLNFISIIFAIPDAPFEFGPMEIGIAGFYNFRPGSWNGVLQAGISSGSGFFGDGENYDVDFSAAVIPAPGAIALFGLAGLSGRRRRD